MAERTISTNEAAKMIRADLKAAFPATKFRVFQSRSGTINVQWTDGPTKARVDEIVELYDGRSFDGSIDLAYYIEAWILDGKIIGKRSRGTAGSGGYVQPYGLEAPDPRAELASLYCGTSTSRTISPALATLCIAQLCAYWGGVTEIPVAVPSKWSGDGYQLEPTGISNRPPRPDIGGNGTGHYYDWSDLIYRAAEDRTKFAREELPPAPAPDPVPRVDVAADIAAAFGMEGLPGVNVAPSSKPSGPLQNDPATVALSAVLAASLAGPAAESQLAELASQCDGILTREQVRASLAVIR